MGDMTKVLSGSVRRNWIDYNGHMGDFAYGIIFSDAATSFMDMIGVDETYRKGTGCTIYTLEVRIAYLKACHLDQKFHVLQQLIDLDGKRFHSYLRMVDDKTGQDLAVCEQLLMHMQQSPGQPSKSKPFPLAVKEKLSWFRRQEQNLPIPEWIGGHIGIHRGPIVSSRPS